MKIFPNYSDDIKNLKQQDDYLIIEFLKIREEIKEIYNNFLKFDGYIAEINKRIDVLEANKPEFLPKDDGLNITDKERILLLEMEISKFKNLLIEKTPQGKEKLSPTGKIFRTKYQS